MVHMWRAWHVDCVDIGNVPIGTPPHRVAIVTLTKPMQPRMVSWLTCEDMLVIPAPLPRRTAPTTRQSGRALRIAVNPTAWGVSRPTTPSRSGAWVAMAGAVAAGVGVAMAVLCSR